MKLQDLYENNSISKREYTLLERFLEDGTIIHDTSTSSPVNGKESISVIIPTHNRFEMLVRCVDSVLAQTYKNIEIIIIDDASTDDEYKGLSDYYSSKTNIKIIRNEVSQGPGETRHIGYLNSNSDYVVYIDDDDFYIDNRFFEIAVEELNKNTELSTFETNSIKYYENKENINHIPFSVTGEIDGFEYLKGFLKKYPKASSSFSTVFRRSHLEKAEFQTMSMMNDHSIFLRAACVGNVYLCNRIVGVYCIHSTNISKGLPHAFLIENLHEKKNIYHILKNIKPHEDLQEWYNHQLFVTVRYYFGGTKVSLKNKYEVLSWLLKASPNAFGKIIVWMSISKIKRYFRPFYWIRKIKWRTKSRLIQLKNIFIKSDNAITEVETNDEFEVNIDEESFE